MKIAVIGTLDTKEREVGFMRDQIVALGHTPVIIDPGVLGQPTLPADVTRQEVARAGGEDLDALIVRRDKAHAQAVMIKGLVNVVARLYAQKDLQGVVAVGGAQGTGMATAAMRALPVGVPKVMLSTVACGGATFGPYVGTKDLTMIHSVADISGLNRITYRLLAQAVGAVAGMAAARVPQQENRELIAITQAGVTTKGVVAVKDQLERMGFEVIAFHCNGIGGQAMEELILNRDIQGVIDFTPHEIVDLLYHGLMPAAPDRLQAAGKMGIPEVVVPGGIDIIVHGPAETLAPELARRQVLTHSPIYTHVRTSPEEMAGVAHFIAERLNAAQGPCASLIPLRGFSMFNREGEAMYDQAGNMAYVETLRRELAPRVEQIQVDAHINDPEFAQATVDTFLHLRKAKPEQKS